MQSEQQSKRQQPTQAQAQAQAGAQSQAYAQTQAHAQIPTQSTSYQAQSPLQKDALMQAYARWPWVLGMMPPRSEMKLQELKDSLTSEVQQLRSTVQALSDTVQQFLRHENDHSKFETRVTQLETELASMKTRLGEMESAQKRQRSDMLRDGDASISSSNSANPSTITSILAQGHRLHQAASGPDLRPRATSATTSTSHEYDPLGDCALDEDDLSQQTETESDNLSQFILHGNYPFFK